MKCPYRNFYECYKDECPAYIPKRENSNPMFASNEKCKFVTNGYAPKTFNNCEQSYLQSAT